MFKGIIVNVEYQIIDDKPLIKVFGRLQNGKSFVSYHEFFPYFYIKKEDLEKAKQILNLKYEETKFKSMNNEELVKVNLKIPKEVTSLRRIFEEHDIQCFEADVPFSRRFLIDKNIRAALNINGQAKKGEFVDLIFEEPQISHLDHLTVKNNLKMLSIDIETDKEAKEIYAISFYDGSSKKSFIVRNSKWKKDPKSNIFDTEKDLLIAFFKEIHNNDPDIITGWNFIDFDLKVIQSRAKKYELDFNIGRSSEPSSLRIESSFLKDSKANAHGRIVLDGIALLKASFIDLENYKLNTAAKEFLGEEKLNTSDDRGDFIEDSYDNDPQMLADYNVKDSVLAYDILIKSNVFELTVQRSMLTGMSMDSVSASIASFDSIYLPELNKKGFVANSTYISDVEQGLGGFVLDAKAGIYDNILVLDFKSLYPSIIRTFNLDPKNFLEFNEKLKYNVDKDVSLIDNDKSKYIISPNGAIHKKDEGILPLMIEHFWEEREKARKQKNEIARFAIKTLMNSLAGVLASPKSRFFNRYLSNSITSFAQFFIQLVMKKVEGYGYTIIYGDTDSIFVDTKTKDVKKAVSIGKNIEKDINEFLKEYIMKNYGCKSILELEFEKTFVKFFIPTKKRYAGLKLLQDGTTKLDFVGLEFVRRDWTELSKEFQMKLLDLIFSDKPIVEFVTKFISDLEKGKYDDLLVYKKSLSKPIESYVKTTPPHVKAAKKLDKINSRVIEYVMTVNGPEPIQKLSSKIDYDHYIDKQIKSIANGVLHVLGKDFDDVMKGSKQSGLGKFF